MERPSSPSRVASDTASRTIASRVRSPSVRCFRGTGTEVSRRVRVRGRGERTLLDNVSFTLSAGELVAIVGPSGVGKTTLLEAISAIVPADSGSVRFDGIDVYANLKTFRSVLGYVPQDDIIHADLPLQRTLRYAARLRLPSPASAAEVDDAVRDAIDAVSLTDHADVPVGSLSGAPAARVVRRYGHPVHRHLLADSRRVRGGVFLVATWCAFVRTTRTSLR